MTLVYEIRDFEIRDFEILDFEIRDSVVLNAMCLFFSFLSFFFFFSFFFYIFWLGLAVVKPQKTDTKTFTVASWQNRVLSCQDPDRSPL